MQHWIPYAMVRVSLFFCIGILFAIYFPDSLSLSGWITILGILAFIYIALYWNSSRLKVWLGITGLFLISILGVIHLYLQADVNKPNHIIHETGLIHAYVVKVDGYPESKSKSWKIEVEIENIYLQDWQLATGRIQLYISKRDDSIRWSYGDRLLIKGSPDRIPGPANPGEFDFRRFLTFRNIHHQHFIRKDDYTVLSKNSEHGIIHYSHLARRWATEKIEHLIQGEQERAIALALILGVTDAIDNELINAYSASGAMHVLAVSGLHVGIIYALIIFLLKPLPRQSWSRWVVAGISLVCLWLFAFVTGLSPSVLRAVTMFSFMAVARPFGIRTNIYNTLAASAFALLLYNPYLIMSVGFQLSYLAVVGIVYLQRPIYNLLEFDTWLGDFVWKITCISIAAQLTTFSLGVLYFHQFPVYFLVSNLFVIPLSTFILIGGIILLSVQFLTPVASLVGWILTYMIKFLNWIVFEVERLPFSLISDIELTTFQCWLLIGILISLILLFERKRVAWLYTAVSLSVVFSLLQWEHFNDSIRLNQLVVYHVRGHSAIDFISNGKVLYYVDSLLLKDNERIRFHIRPHRLHSGVFQLKAASNAIVKNGFQYYHFANRLIAIAKTKGSLPRQGWIDFLVISKGTSPPYEPLPQLKIGQIILDSSVSKWQAMAWKKWAAGIPLHDVASDRAFVVTL